ncbi:MAG: bifunctional lysylphosphatidylglycerol flippase/synthetase MprF [Propionibacteriaceae bacterium]
MKTSVGYALAWLKSGPINATLAVIIFTTSLATGELIRPLSPRLRSQVADGFVPISQGRWFSPLTSIFFAPHFLVAIFFAAALCTLGIAAERKLGTVRTLIFGLSGQLLGGLVAASASILANYIDHAWGRSIMRDLHVGCEPWLVALILSASQILDILWRRRVRVVAGIALGMLAVFGGSHRDIAMLTAAATGGIIGRLSCAEGPQRSLAGTRHERRNLVSLAVLGFLVASLASTFAGSPVGPLASIRLLFRELPWDAEQVAQFCANPTMVRECRRGTYLLRNVGVPAAIASAAPLALLAALVRGLRHGRLAAWRGTLLVLGGYLALWIIRIAVVIISFSQQILHSSIAVDTHFAPTPRPLLPAVFLTILLVLVFLSRKQFTILLPKRSYRMIITRTAVVTLVTFIAALAIGLLLRRSFTPTATVLTLAHDFFLRLLPTGTLGIWTTPIFAKTSPAAVFSELLPAIPWLWLAGELWRVFGRNAEDATTADRARMVSLLKEVGGSTLSWWGTWGDGNRWWFSTNYQAGVAYRIVGDVAVTPCAPVCRSKDTAGVVEEFATWAADRSLTPAFYSVHDDVAAATQALGWASIEVAEETFLDPRLAEFKGKKFQDIRTSINRAEREGIHVESGRWADFSPARRRNIAAISEGWVATKGLPEMGFTLGGLEELDDPDVVIWLALDETDRIHGITSWLPIYRDNKLIGFTLDFMRRWSGGFKMSMELLIASMILQAKTDGLEIISLSGAPLARAIERHESGSVWNKALDAGLQKVSVLLEPAYGFRSLLAFKAKFQPDYRPMYLTVPDIADLPAVGRAIAGAYIPGLGITDSLRISSNLLRHPRCKKQKEIAS